ncbi:MAG: hypothetical protein ACRCY4_00215 [Brevinema sp.]
MDTKPLSIYQEFIFPVLPYKTMFELLESNTAWRELFASKGHELPDFSQKLEGIISWRRFHFFTETGQYSVVSYKENQHILMDIITKNMRSTLLITVESKNDTLVLRLDHRSFVGAKANSYLRYFTKYWKKMFSLYASEKKI